MTYEEAMSELSRLGKVQERGYSDDGVYRRELRVCADGIVPSPALERAWFEAARSVAEDAMLQWHRCRGRIYMSLTWYEDRGGTEVAA